MCRSICRLLLFAGAGITIVGTNLEAQAVPPPSPAAPLSITLDAALAAALAENPLVDAARARVTASAGSQRTAAALPNPVGTYWSEGHEISAYATLPVEPFLQRSSRIARASADARAAAADMAGTERDVAVRTAQAFYRAALAQAARDAMRENRAAAQQLVEYLRARVSEGASPEGDVIRAEVERDRADADMTMADVEWLRAQAALCQWLGANAPPRGALRVALPDAAQFGAPLTPFADFATHALAQRPELIGARARADAAASAIDVEHALAVRQLGASFGLKRVAGDTVVVAGLSMTIPLFDRNRGEIERATGERLAATAEVRWLERSVSSEVDAAYQSAVRLAAKVATLEPAFVRRAEESRQIALGAYREGAASLLQVLDASRALADARLIVARMLAAAGESRFALGIAAGYDPRVAARLGPAAAPAGPAHDGGVR